MSSAHPFPLGLSPAAASRRGPRVLGFAPNSLNRGRPATGKDERASPCALSLLPPQVHTPGLGLLPCRSLPLNLGGAVSLAVPVLAYGGIKVMSCHAESVSSRRLEPANDRTIAGRSRCSDASSWRRGRARHVET